MAQTSAVTKHLDLANTKRLKDLLCYNLMEGVIDEEEEIFLAAKPNLFMLKTITLLEPKILSVVIFSVEVGTKDLMFNFPHFEGEISVDIVARIKVQELEIAQWMLPEDH
jgi:hypothetical protein